MHVQREAGPRAVRGHGHRQAVTTHQRVLPSCPVLELRPTPTVGGETVKVRCPARVHDIADPQTRIVRTVRTPTARERAVSGSLSDEL
ncbi:hypothetical protein JCM9534A_75790 [Catenuloplanes indicus JCM 9534]